MRKYTENAEFYPVVPLQKIFVQMFDLKLNTVVFFTHLEFVGHGCGNLKKMKKRGSISLCAPNYGNGVHLNAILENTALV